MGLLRSADVDKLIAHPHGDGGPLTRLYEKTLAAIEDVAEVAFDDDQRKMLSNALCEAADLGATLVDSKTVSAAPAEIHHTYAPAHGSVRVKYTQNGRGVNVEVSIDRPRLEGEDFDQTKTVAVQLATDAYRLAHDQLDLGTFPAMPVSIVDGGRT